MYSRQLLLLSLAVVVVVAVAKFSSCLSSFHGWVAGTAGCCGVGSRWDGWCGRDGCGRDG